MTKKSAVTVQVMNPSRPFYVTDLNGIVYYLKQGKQTYTFNLPEGEYRFNQPVQVLNVSEPIRFKLKKDLPTPEHRFNNYRFTIETVNQPGYAQVRFPEGVITVNEKFHTLPAPVQFWVIEHEKGHKFYKTEDFADLYALKKYLDKGFNPSTIIQAFESGLLRDTPENSRRMKNFFSHFNNIIEVQK